jgi:hypothetical protein
MNHFHIILFTWVRTVERVGAVVCTAIKRCHYNIYLKNNSTIFEHLKTILLFCPN